MKNINTKIDDNDTSQGVVVASDYNAAFSEIKNAVLQNEDLDEVDNLQLTKAIQRSASSLYYLDSGTVNTITLTRYAPQRVKNETLTGGETLLFRPKLTNTSSEVTIKVGDTPRKGVGLITGTLDIGSINKDATYLAVFSSEVDKYVIEAIGGDTLYYRKPDVDEKLRLLIPAGAIFTFPFFNNAPPDGFLWCDGGLHDRVQYKRLFDVIGTTYNFTQLTTTEFNVPDYRNQFLRGITPGRAIGNREADMFRTHAHTFGSLNERRVLAPVTANPPPANGRYDGHVDYYEKSSNVATDTDADYTMINESGGHETRPMNVAVAYAIKY